MRTRRKKHPGVKTEIGRDDEHARVYRLSDLLGRMWGIETRSRRNPVHIRFMIICRGRMVNTVMAVLVDDAAAL
jgi:hypothetical protein